MDFLTKKPLPENQKRPAGQASEGESKIDYKLTQEQEKKFSERKTKLNAAEFDSQDHNSEWRKIENLPRGYKSRFEEMDKALQEDEILSCFEIGERLYSSISLSGSHDQLNNNELLRSQINIALNNWYKSNQAQILARIFDENRLFKSVKSYEGLHYELLIWQDLINKFGRDNALRKQPFDNDFDTKFNALFSTKYPALLTRELHEMDKLEGNALIRRFNSNRQHAESLIKGGLITEEMLRPFNEWRKDNLSKLKQAQIEIVEMAFLKLAAMDFTRDSAELKADLLDIAAPLMTELFNNPDEELRISAFDLLESRADKFNFGNLFDAAGKAGLKNDALFIEFAKKFQDLEEMLPKNSPLGEKLQRKLTEFLAGDVEKADGPENAEAKKAYAILLHEINESMGIMTRVANITEEDAVKDFNERKERLYQQFKGMGLEFPQPLDKTVAKKDDPFEKAVFDYFVQNGFVFTDGILPFRLAGKEVFLTYLNLYPVADKEVFRINEYFLPWKEKFPEIFGTDGTDFKVPIYRLGAGQATLLAPLKAASQLLKGQYLHGSIIVMDSSDKSTISNEAGHAFFEKVLKLQDGGQFEYDGEMRYAYQFNELISDLAELRYGHFDETIQRLAQENTITQYDFSYDFFQRKMKEVNFQHEEYVKMSIEERAELKEKFLSAAEDEVFRKILPIAKKSTKE